MALTPAGVDFLRDHIEDHTYQLQWWPKYQRELLLESDLKYAGRFQLTIYLLGNRLTPVTIASWFVGRNMLKDQAAKKHVAELIRAHMDGKLAKYDVYVMHATLANGDPPSMFEFRNGDSLERPFSILSIARSAVLISSALSGALFELIVRKKLLSCLRRANPLS